MALPSPDLHSVICFLPAVALAGVFLADLTGEMVFDGLESVIIGVNLGITACWLACEPHGLLIGEAANQRVVNGIRDLVAGFDEVRHVNEVLTMHMGPDFILPNLSVKSPTKPPPGISKPPPRVSTGRSRTSIRR